VNFFRLIFNSSLFVLLVRKPINTFFPFLYLSKKKYKRDALIWQSEKHYSADQYLTLDAPSNEFITYVIECTNKTDTILDLCCNQGRFLKKLDSVGYNSLHGVDIMCPAIDLLLSYKPIHSDAIAAECDYIQDYLPRVPDNAVDYAITYSATIELLNPCFNIYRELSRICRKGFIFALNEDGHSYPRFYRYLPLRYGFKTIKISKLSSSGLTLMHYEK